MADIESGDDRWRLDVDPIERLRRANPVPAEEVADEVRSARARATFEEITMQELQTPTRDRGPLRRYAPRLAAAAAAAAVAVAAGVALSNGTRPDPAPIADDGTDPVSPGGGFAMCVETYSLETLPNRDIAFAGTVTAIEGDTATFAVEETFRGDLGDQVQLEGAMGLTAITVDNEDPIAVGDRLLVSGSDGFAWGCGFTMAYDATVAQQWREALAD